LRTDGTLPSPIIFVFEQRRLVADLSVPLSFMADVPLFPSIRSRYFKRTDRGVANHRKWRIKIQNFDVEGNGKRLP
jgi:hypothetical protein